MRYLNAPTLILPGIVACLLIGGLYGFPFFYLSAMLLGGAEIVWVAAREIRAKNFSLDYIALLALVLSATTDELLAGAVIAFMYTTGEALETYASRRAEASLASLLARIPKTALVRHGETVEPIALADVTQGSIIVVRGGELVPLDGFLKSAQAVLNLANLTGEALPERVLAGAVVKSGSVNAGEAFDLEVSGTLATSTYAKIVDLVKNAKQDEAPFVRLSTRANIPFTLLTAVIAGGAYLFTHDLTRVLAVLVIATPCPLIIAAPVAFIGGLSRAASRNIIVKTPAILERTARVTTIFFDKTGTLTLGEPTLTSVDILEDAISETKALYLAAALEFHSIHPLARAIVETARARSLTPPAAHDVTETIGVGIRGTVEGAVYSLAQAPDRHHQPGSISLLLSRETEPLAVLHFADVLKDHVKGLLGELTRGGYSIAMVTGDRKENAEAIFKGLPIMIHADCTPEEKYRIVERARSKGGVVAMVGDGLNDAPALARADVGIVFSGTENSASIEAADVAILGHNVGHIHELLAFSKRSVRIAWQSVVTGIGLSALGMLLAAFGGIAPVDGAILQEGIDVSVIVNALRAAFAPRW